ENLPHDPPPRCGTFPRACHNAPRWLHAAILRTVDQVDLHLALRHAGQELIRPGIDFRRAGGPAEILLVPAAHPVPVVLLALDKPNPPVPAFKRSRIELAGPVAHAALIGVALKQAVIDLADPAAAAVARRREELGRADDAGHAILRPAV